MENALSARTGVIQSQIQGEPGTGFEKVGKLGKFECGNCFFYKDDSCGQQTMMARSKQPKLPNGRVKVADTDCCEYVKRMGRNA
jgi:hypothetical protein